MKQCHILKAVITKYLQNIPLRHVNEVKGKEHLGSWAVQHQKESEHNVVPNQEKG